MDSLPLRTLRRNMLAVNPSVEGTWSGWAGVWKVGGGVRQSSCQTGGCRCWWMRSRCGWCA